MASNKELSYEIPNFIRVYKDGTIERPMVSPYISPYVSPSLQDPINGISSKDIVISPHVSARLYLPAKTPPTNSQQLPIFVYVHGGGFVFGSAFTLLEHNYLNTIVSHINALVISVEYRLAPEHLLPTAYEDCWTALQWVASHATNHGRNLENPESWLVEFGDFERLYIGGDSAGGNIVHNMALQAGRESLNGDVKILGGFLGCPYFWSSLYGVEGLPYGCWMMAHPQAEGGIDSPMINPFVGGGRGFAAEYGVKKLLVVATEKDELREIDSKYFEAIKESEWNGEVEFVEIEGESHCFYVLDSTNEKAKIVMERLASFIV
ncbi:2-hydroxyisoflavanone dehydratase-like [Cynara cardunculus var. scolymus]|uniref:Alpha/beta hydrolase fold-3 n=1 Tax=Cynara cardunculus var. scolymus TaxID=59895 RepID=A0A103XU74_CYNCS|nr:2-hydroxyisoflavanone dehydratase-like [Cynara cardunculus var. scolymus]KVH96992.1 Alpha/beta hydrolase fold-3 [Cynara cardunculus var. scolymus]